jgi:hypothetical protein
LRAHLKEKEGDNADTSDQDEQGGYETENGEKDQKQQDGKRQDGKRQDGKRQDDAWRLSRQLAWQAEVVRRGKYRVDLSTGRVVQEGCCDDCAKPGFEEGFAEGAIVRHADADILCEPRREEFAEEPTACAGACEGVAARAHGDDEGWDGEAQRRTQPRALEYFRFY